MRKKYEAPGMMEWHPVIAAGRSRVMVSFEGGHFSGRGQTPATYETSDPAVQILLESSDLFKSGRIRLAAGFKKEVAKDTSPRRKGSPHLKQMEFADLEKARDFLAIDNRIPKSKVLTVDDCVKAAAGIGIDLRIMS